MTELTKEQLIEEAKLKIAIAKCHPNSGMARVEGELFKIALASLEAEPIGAFHIVEQQVDGTSYYIKDGEWPIDTGIIEVYAASPMTVALNDVSGSLALAYKELTPAIMRNHIAVFERYGITPNDSITTIHALRIALDGIERSDVMLHGRQPCHQITASMAKAIALKLGAELNNEEAEIFADGYNAAVLHGGKFRGNTNSSTNNFREISETSTSSPVTPDGWISCSERMPEKNQNVLISVNFDSDLVEPLICSARYTGSTFRRGETTIKPGNGIGQATHWMPLPEPPQEVNR
ncbi:putative phage protein [Escherichia coli]|nr:putative phage protein [Escherichia coli]